VAHMDTVHAIMGEPIVPVEIDGKVTGLHASNMSQTGIGGDDKCGIYAALQIMSKMPSCKAAFFVDEEVGCLGSSDCDMTFFTDCAFVLQADRRGSSDFVTSIGGRPLASDAWLDAIAPLVKAHGFSHCAGAMTDVQALRDGGVGICCANLSAGYYNPHTDGEYIDLHDLDNVTKLMLNICRQHGAQRWPYVPPAKVAPSPAAWWSQKTDRQWTRDTAGGWTLEPTPPPQTNRRPRGMPRSVWRDLREEAAYREERQRLLAEYWPYDLEEEEDDARLCAGLESES